MQVGGNKGKSTKRHRVQGEVSGGKVSRYIRALYVGRVERGGERISATKDGKRKNGEFHSVVGGP